MTKKETRSAVEMHKIGAAAKMIGVSPETLRVWEKQGLIRARYTPAGYRLFSEEEIARVTKIQNLRSQGINIAGISALMSSVPDSGREEPAVVNDPSIGRILRQLRISGGLSLVTVANRAKLSASFVSLVERGVANASKESLSALAHALGIPLSKILGKKPSKHGREFVSAKERRRLPSMNNKIEIQQLAGSPDERVDPRIFVMQPGSNSGGFYAHDGVEFIYVLKGSLRLRIENGETYQLTQGDSAFFSSDRPHEWSVEGKSALEVLWIDMHTTLRISDHIDVDPKLLRSLPK
jgi:DNA-binding transcriptional MerR regulator